MNHLREKTGRDPRVSVFSSAECTRVEQGDSHHLRVALFFNFRVFETLAPFQPF